MYNDHFELKNHNYRIFNPKKKSSLNFKFMEYFTHYHNKPQFMYCPQFLLGQFSPLSLSYDSPKYHFSHQEPGHNFIASLKNKFTVSFMNLPDDYKKWLYSLELYFSPDSSVKIQSNNEYSVNFTSPRKDLLMIAKTNSFFISKNMYFDHFLSDFSFKFGNPMIFDAQFSDGAFQFGCKVSSSNDVNVLNRNMFYQMMQGQHFSYITFIICNSTSISRFVFSNTISIRYPRFCLSSTFMIGDGYLFLSTGFKYTTDKFKIGIFGKYNTNNVPRNLDQAIGVKYHFSNRFATSLVFKYNYFSIGTEFKHNGNIMKPMLKFKFDEPAVGFQFSFISNN